MALFGADELDDFFENAPLALHWVGADGTIVRANRFELDLLGYERHEYEGKHIAEFHVDEDAIVDILDRLARGETLRDYPARLRAKDGSIKDVLINSNVRWVEGEFGHTRCFTRDISDRVRAERELERANRELEQIVAERTAELRQANEGLKELVHLKERFVAMVSHELRTPLTSIAGFSTTMRRYWDSLPDDQKRQFVEIISTQSERLGRLVDDLLTLSRLSSGALTVRPRPVALHALAAETVRELDAADVAVSGTPELEASADPDYTKQILVNYVTNALKYGRPPVEIVLRRTDAAELLVCDRGPGVAEDVIPQLFTPFARALSHDDGEPPSGTGIGLSIVRQLAQAMGGEAWYEPNRPEGAVFGIRLPLADSIAPAA